MGTGAGTALAQELLYLEFMMVTLSNPDLTACGRSIPDHRSHRIGHKLHCLCFTQENGSTMQAKPGLTIVRLLKSVGSLRLLCALGLFLVLPLFAGPLDGRWSSFSQGLLPTQGQAYRLSSDSLGTVYLSTAKTTFTYDGTRFDSLAVSKTGEVAALINSPEDYWLMYDQSHLYPGLIPPAEIVHVVRGIRQPPAGCVVGNHLQVLGRDVQGKLLIQQGSVAQSGPVPLNLIRYSDQGCDTVDVGVGNTGMAPVAYARDSLGREYFAIQTTRDIRECGPVVRLDQGKLDTLLDSACVSAMVPLGSRILMAVFEGQGRGLWINSDSGTRKIETILGKPVPQPNALFKDRLGVVWVGINDGGLLALAERDTVLFSPGAADYNGQPVMGFAEDAEGNIWLSTGYPVHGLSVFLQGDPPLSLAGRIQPEFQRQRPYKGFDVLGRYFHGGSRDFPYSGMKF